MHTHSQTQSWNAFIQLVQLQKRWKRKRNTEKWGDLQKVMCNMTGSCLSYKWISLCTQQPAKWAPAFFLYFRGKNSLSDGDPDSSLSFMSQNTRLCLPCWHTYIKHKLLFCFEYCKNPITRMPFAKGKRKNI